MSMRTETIRCHDCGTEYQSIGHHWVANNECSHPQFTERQHEIITGLLMGDGCIVRRDGTPSLKLVNTQRDFVEWVGEQFGIMGGDVVLHDSHQGGQEERENALYTVLTRASPEFREYANWYNEDQRRFPNDLQLTPLKLKMWYVSDGTLSERPKRGAYIRLTCKNEGNRLDFLHSLFTDIGFDPTVNDPGHIHFNVRETPKLLEYMGNPIPGYKYKWIGE